MTEKKQIVTFEDLESTMSDWNKWLFKNIGRFIIFWKIKSQFPVKGKSVNGSELIAAEYFLLDPRPEPKSRTWVKVSC